MPRIYISASRITLPALLLAGLGFLLEPESPVIPVPAQTAPASTQPGAFSGDVATCSQAISGYTTNDEEQQIIDACTRMIQGTVSGQGKLPAFQPYADRAFAEEGMGSNVLALADLTQAVALAPSNDEIYRLRAGIDNALKNFPAALADTQKALSLHPTNWAVLTEQAAAEFGLNEFKASLTDSMLASQHLPQYARAQLIRGEAEAALGDNRDAVRDITLYLQQSPPDPVALYGRGYAEEDISGDVPVAKADFLASLQGSPDNLQDIDQLTDLAVMQQDWPTALRYANQGLALNSEDVGDMVARGSGELFQGQYKAANADASAVLKVSSDPRTQAVAWYISEVSLYQEGHYRDAVPALNKAVQFNPGDQSLASMLAAVRLQEANSK